MSKFVIMTNDGAGYENVFLAWSNDFGGYYTTVDYLDEVNEGSVCDTIAQAEDMARDADSGTFGGWQAPMIVVEVLNYDDVINNDDEPELKEVKVVELN